MSTITTHILDTAKGCPAEGVRVVLYGLPEAVIVASGITDKNGRIGEWPAVGKGTYAMRFETGHYFGEQSVRTFYPFVEVHFETTADGHYHIPLLISPFGYSTYRGS